ncbi:DNA-binding response regulator, NarL/FixJ family, contains REC and HTH domains [Nocardioides terrae]|uniref:DNA-binding response regulator, NarL/FixJ family, contains REC and HTH domains n=1 Tax=Nocardioides terrae TaxID=574651 RepID=A0A1I1HUG2_9ACTN|nr:LuxR C-terminal-related transcriptional regulator [Nocardioides terrae]SFC27697.1 DNA-binding response regulator, NarL/FixJ family, contains REC and HTH domains [Nocardioides terrae]
MATSPTGESLRVLVASDQALIAEAVRAALDSRGHDVIVVRWPGEKTGAPRRRPAPPAPMSQVGLLLSDLDRWSRIKAAMLLVERIPVPWAVLTTSPRGPAWGAILSVGARVVLPGSTRLDHITSMLTLVVSDELRMPDAERSELETSWEEMRARHDAVAERLATLTPREGEVLRLMYAGSSVARIAEMLEVAPATVRSQVKAVLRKLDVNNQLAAVAAFDDVMEVRPAAYRLPTPRTSEPVDPAKPAKPAVH